MLLIQFFCVYFVLSVSFYTHRSSQLVFSIVLFFHPFSLFPLFKTLLLQKLLLLFSTSASKHSSIFRFCLFWSFQAITIATLSSSTLPTLRLLHRHCGICSPLRRKASPHSSLCRESSLTLLSMCSSHGKRNTATHWEREKTKKKKRREKKDRKTHININTDEIERTLFLLCTTAIRHRLQTYFSRCIAML